MQSTSIVSQLRLSPIPRTLQVRFELLPKAFRARRLFDESAALSVSFRAFASTDTVKKSSDAIEDKSLNDELADPALELSTERKCETTT